VWSFKGLNIPSGEEAGKSAVAMSCAGASAKVTVGHQRLSLVSKGVVEAVLAVASWQRCMVHFMRNALSFVPNAAQRMVGTTIRSVFAQPDAMSAHQRWRRVSEDFSARFARLWEPMEEAEEDVLSYAALPVEHWRKIWSNDPSERLNKEVGRRPNVVGIFPNEAEVVRLVSSVSSERQN
jgi:putative transposase